MKVIIYTTSHCPYCDEAKHLFDVNDIAYESKNIELDEDAFTELRGKLNGKFRGVPVIDINGTIIEGLDRAKIKKALSI